MGTILRWKKPGASNTACEVSATARTRRKGHCSRSRLRHHASQLQRTHQRFHSLSEKRRLRPISRLPYRRQNRCLKIQRRQTRRQTENPCQNIQTRQQDSRHYRNTLGHHNRQTDRQHRRCQQQRKNQNQKN